jgi:biotin operon repressor
MEQYKKIDLYILDEKTGQYIYKYSTMQAETVWKAIHRLAINKGIDIDKIKGKYSK